MGFAGRGMRKTEHGMVAGNGNVLYREDGMGMAEYGIPAYPLPF
jgi:hypothetical protein